MYTCGDIKEHLSGDDVKEQKDLDIRWLIYMDVEVTEKDFKKWQEDHGEQRREKWSMDNTNEGPVGGGGRGWHSWRGWNLQ